jgi:hypothetical protein
MVGTVLDTVIGLSFVFGLTALMVTATVEGVAAKANKRSKWLLRGIQQLFGETTPTPDKDKVLDSVRPGRVRAERETYETALQIAAPAKAVTGTPAKAPAEPSISWKQILAHPLLQVLTQRKADGKATRLPTEIPAELFARCLLDLLDPAGEVPLTPKELTKKLAALGDDDIDEKLEKALQAIIKTLPPTDAAALKKAIEDWFKGQMKSVSEAYRRWTKRWAIGIGIGVAIFLNISAIGVFQTLYTEQPTRDATVALATSGEICPDATDAAALEKCASEKLTALHAAGLPVGWNNMPKTWSEWGKWLKGFLPHVGDLFDQSSDYLRWLGWILTGLAASFGAPFWFDTIKRVSAAKKTLEGT